MQLAPLRGLRYDRDRLGDGGPAAGKSVTSPPYDVITPQAHRRLLDASPYNITRLTLGAGEGEAPDYGERARLLERWVADGVLARDEAPRFYAYTIEYHMPGTDCGASRRTGEGSDGGPIRFVGLIALGRLHPFEDGVVLRHEQTFAKVVDDRFRLLEASRANLENILLLYSDPDREIDAVLENQVSGQATVRVEAAPGEFHSLYAFSAQDTAGRLVELFGPQRPIIADGHHRYTTALRFAEQCRRQGTPVPGADWRMMTFANLYGKGLSILATHRLVKLRDPCAAVKLLLARLEPSSEREADFRIETAGAAHDVRIPEALLRQKHGVARTAYAFLHDVVIDDWLAPHVDGPGAVAYFKEGTGEREALARGDGDLLFRMKPVDRREFESVVQGGEVFPHKTTYFYPKLWSGLVLWLLEDPVA